MHHIEDEVLDDLIASYIRSLRRKLAHETVSLRRMISSLDLQLRPHKYLFSIMNGYWPQFNLTRDTYNAKKKALKIKSLKKVVNMMNFFLELDKLNTKAVQRLVKRFKESGSVEDRPHSNPGRLRLARTDDAI